MEKVYVLDAVFVQLILLKILLLYLFIAFYASYWLFNILDIFVLCCIFQKYSKMVNLKNPPIIVALCQIKYFLDGIKLDSFLQYDKEIKKFLPLRKENLHVGINLGNASIPIGHAKISGTSEAQIETYIYFSDDQKCKLEISCDTITYIDENPYIGWNHFKEDTLKFFSIFSKLLSVAEIKRMSIRYVNRFCLPEFNNPQDYFNTQISSSNDTENPLPFPLRQYSFKLQMDVPKTSIYSIINQGVEILGTDNYEYIFDIDVLDRQNLIFDMGIINNNLDKLCEIKNKIFFSNTTPKTLDLCN
jgi:uncharacterized protein (TIGR04255 family)